MGNNPASGPPGVMVPLANRPRRDNGWTLAWVIVYLGTVAAGVATFLNRNVNFASQISPDYLNDPAHCPSGAASGRRSLLGMRAMDDDGDPLSLDEFMSVALYWLVGSVVGALLVGMLFVALVSRNPKLLVGVAISLQIALPLAAGTGALFAGSLGGGIPLLLLAGAVALLFWMWREQLSLVCELLGVSGTGLRENLGLVGATIAVHAGLMVLCAPLLMATLSAVTNGHVAPNPSAAASPGPGQCTDAEGNEVMCCEWSVDGHVAPVMTLAMATLLWTSFIASQVRTFTVAATIAQWYFAPVVDPMKGPGARSGSRVGSALGAALGPAFGSLCFGALILTAVSMLRSALEELKKKASDNIFFYCLFVLVQYLFTIVEMVTKFATVRCAITGEAFWAATRGVATLLERAFLDSFGVWWFPPMILQMCGLVLSALWSAVVYFAAAASWSGLSNGRGYAGIVAAVSFVLSWLVLSFFAALLLDIVDTVFVCFAMDRDAAAVSRADVHAVYNRLPSVKPIVIEQPGGGYAIGQAPQQQYASV
ncbi:hypothetical protein FOA52_002787 [Chlamydomonas sp. UWO 241]|nr:hypothetical protein FOA52_002787 [Chlamydomonas sp. UWO 241]